MVNTLQKYEALQLEKLTKDKAIPEFFPGDTICVNVKIVEGTSERVQAFEGVCIAKKSRGLQSAFTVRKISHGEGVERIFPLYSPMIDSIKVVRSGSVRRAKLYYMRNLFGKAARIDEKVDLLKSMGYTGEAAVASDTPLTPEEAAELAKMKAEKAAKAKAGKQPKVKKEKKSEEGKE